MPDSAGNPTPPNPSPTTVVTGPGAVIAAGTSAAELVSNWSPTQVVVIGCVLSMAVTNGLLVWSMIASRTDRSDERKIQSEREAIVMRSIEDGREKDRVSNASLHKEVLEHCKGAQREMLAVHASEREKDRNFHADVIEKLRIAIGNIATAVGKIQMTVERKEEEMGFGAAFPFGIPLPMPAWAAPMPREKLLLLDGTTFNQDATVIPVTPIFPVPDVPPTRSHNN